MRCKHVHRAIFLICWEKCVFFLCVTMHISYASGPCNTVRTPDISHNIGAAKGGAEEKQLAQQLSMSFFLVLFVLSLSLKPLQPFAVAVWDFSVWMNLFYYFMPDFNFHLVSTVSLVLDCFRRTLIMVQEATWCWNISLLFSSFFFWFCFIDSNKRAAERMRLKNWGGKK